jgi:hypothetical protein
VFDASTLLPELSTGWQAAAMQSAPIVASRLSEEDVQAFRRLMLEECGVDLSLADAWTRATKMVAMFRALIGPIPEDPGLRDATCPQATPLA